MSSNEVLVFQIALRFYVVFLGYRLSNRFAEMNKKTMAEENIIEAKKAFNKKLIEQQLESDKYWLVEDAKVLAQEKFIVGLLLLVACIAAFMYLTGYPNRFTLLKKWLFVKNQLIPYLKRYFF